MKLVTIFIDSLLKKINSSVMFALICRWTNPHRQDNLNSLSMYEDKNESVAEYFEFIKARNPKKFDEYVKRGSIADGRNSLAFFSSRAIAYQMRSQTLIPTDSGNGYQTKNPHSMFHPQHNDQMILESSNFYETVYHSPKTPSGQDILKEAYHNPGAQRSKSFTNNI